jgi:hypothetical protein
MGSEQRINRQGRAFIEPRMLHARQPGGAIDRGQHRDNVFLVARGRRETLVNARHWMAASIISRCGRAMSISRGVHVLQDVLWHRLTCEYVNICTVLDSTLISGRYSGTIRTTMVTYIRMHSAAHFCRRVIVLYNIDETRVVAWLA